MNQYNVEIHTLLLFIIIFIFHGTHAITSLHCNEYLSCEAIVVQEHLRCSESSRKLSAKTCGLESDYRQLQVLTLRRQAEYSICVGRESTKWDGLTEEELLDYASYEHKELPDSCTQLPTPPPLSQNCSLSLWVNLKACDQLRECCPEAKTCIREISKMIITKQLRAKRLELDSLTRNCTNKMKKFDGTIRANIPSSSGHLENNSDAIEEEMLKWTGNSEEEDFMKETTANPTTMQAASTDFPFHPMSSTAEVVTSSTDGPTSSTNSESGFKWATQPSETTSTDDVPKVATTIFAPTLLPGSTEDDFAMNNAAEASTLDPSRISTGSPTALFEINKEDGNSSLVRLSTSSFRHFNSFTSTTQEPVPDKIVNSRRPLPIFTPETSNTPNSWKSSIPSYNTESYGLPPPAVFNNPEGYDDVLLTDHKDDASIRTTTSTDKLMKEELMFNTDTQNTNLVDLQKNKETLSYTLNEYDPTHNRRMFSTETPKYVHTFSEQSTEFQGEWSNSNIQVNVADANVLNTDEKIGGRSESQEETRTRVPLMPSAKPLPQKSLVIVDKSSEVHPMRDFNWVSRELDSSEITHNEHLRRSPQRFYGSRSSEWTARRPSAEPGLHRLQVLTSTPTSSYGQTFGGSHEVSEVNGTPVEPPIRATSFNDFPPEVVRPIKQKKNVAYATQTNPRRPPMKSIDRDANSINNKGFAPLSIKEYRRPNMPQVPIAPGRVRSGFLPVEDRETFQERRNSLTSRSEPLIPFNNGEKSENMAPRLRIRNRKRPESQPRFIDRRPNSIIDTTTIKTPLRPESDAVRELMRLLENESEESESTTARNGIILDRDADILEPASTRFTVRRPWTTTVLPAKRTVLEEKPRLTVRKNRAKIKHMKDEKMFDISVPEEMRSSSFRMQSAGKKNPAHKSYAVYPGTIPRLVLRRQNLSRAVSTSAIYKPIFESKIHPAKIVFHKRNKNIHHRGHGRFYKPPAELRPATIDESTSKIVNRNYVENEELEPFGGGSNALPIPMFVPQHNSPEEVYESLKEDFERIHSEAEENEVETKGKEPIKEKNVIKEDNLTDPDMPPWAPIQHLTTPVSLSQNATRVAKGAGLPETALNKALDTSLSRIFERFSQPTIDTQYNQDPLPPANRHFLDSPRRLTMHTRRTPTTSWITETATAPVYSFIKERTRKIHVPESPSHRSRQKAKSAKQYLRSNRFTKDNERVLSGLYSNPEYKERVLKSSLPNTTKKPFFRNYRKPSEMFTAPLVDRDVDEHINLKGETLKAVLLPSKNIENVLEEERFFEDISSEESADNIEHTTTRPPEPQFIDRDSPTRDIEIVSVQRIQTGREEPKILQMIGGNSLLDRVVHAMSANITVNRHNGHQRSKSTSWMSNESQEQAEVVEPTTRNSEGLRRVHVKLDSTQTPQNEISLFGNTSDELSVPIARGGVIYKPKKKSERIAKSKLKSIRKGLSKKKSNKMRKKRPKSPRKERNYKKDTTKSKTVARGNTFVNGDVPLDGNSMKSESESEIAEPIRHQAVNVVDVDNTITAENITEDEELEKKRKRMDILEHPYLFPDMSSCELYITCLDELHSLEENCTGSAGRLMPGLPKRRVGDCNKKLVPKYQEIDTDMKRITSMFTECLVDRIVLEKSNNWDNEEEPPLCSPLNRPSLIPNRDGVCLRRVHHVQSLCNKYSKCCSATNGCRQKVDSSEIGVELRRKKSELNIEAANCQIESLKEYKRKNVLNGLKKRRSSKTAKRKRI